MNSQSISKNQVIRELLLIVVGSILYALSVVLFIDPIHVIPGSVTGIAVITKALFNTPIGVVNLVINIPLILVAVFYLGKKLLIYTVITIFLTSVLMDWWAFLPAFTTDMMLASVFGGVVMGIGLGMILKAGATTGGTTVVGRLVVRKHPNIQIGNVLMAGDFVIITVGSILLKDWDLMLYSLINLYICSALNNVVIYGFDRKVAALVYTGSPEKVRDALHDRISCRTMLTREGLLCCCAKSSMMKLERIVKESDVNASCAVADACYTFGGITGDSTAE